MAICLSKKYQQLYKILYYMAGNFTYRVFRYMVKKNQRGIDRSHCNKQILNSFYVSEVLAST